MSLSLNAGDTLGLVGETGAEKTTIAKSISMIFQDPMTALDVTIQAQALSFAP